MVIMINQYEESGLKQITALKELYSVSLTSETARFTSYVSFVLPVTLSSLHNLFVSVVCRIESHYFLLEWFFITDIGCLS